MSNNSILCDVEWDDEDIPNSEEVSIKKVNGFVSSLICCGCTNIYVDGTSFDDWDEHSYKEAT